MHSTGKVLKEVPATYDDLVALPEFYVGEIVDDQLYASPRPAPPHAYSASVVGADLLYPFHHGRNGPGGWWILDEPELHLGRDVLVPDVAGWRRQRMPVLPDEAFFTVPPDWVCEVLSPATASLDRIQKLRAYAQQEIAWAWLIDPRAQTLEIFQRQDEHWLLLDVQGGNTTVRAMPFSEVALDIGAWWAPETPAAPDAV